MSAGLSLSHGANDAQKAMGVIAALLLADGKIDSFAVPLWVKVSCGAVLTLGTALGGWRIVKTVGRRIFRLQPIDGLASQTSSTAVILSASLVGGPVSTTQVVASSVVGIGIGRGRIHHVRWQVVENIGVAWVTTIPGAAAPRGRLSPALEGVHVRASRWFLPESPDVLGMLRTQSDNHGAGARGLRGVGRR